MGVLKLLMTFILGQILVHAVCFNAPAFAEGNGTTCLQIISETNSGDNGAGIVTCAGDATALMTGQDSKLEADTIVYDNAKEMIEARGNVRIIRKKEVTIGSSFRFKAASEEYLVTVPDTSISEVRIASRAADPAKSSPVIVFRKGQKISFIRGVDSRTAAGVIHDQEGLNFQAGAKKKKPLLDRRFVRLQARLLAGRACRQP